jgi:alkylation response protein AidB-like acyl-CoA dehydrogenase
MDATVLNELRQRATIYDQTGDWPAEDLEALAKVGAMKWAVPKQFGGDELSPMDLHLRYEQIASASLSTALVLTQRDSAIGLIESGENEALRKELLPRLAQNEMFATVGIAQLTTSHQRGAPALIARRVNGGFQLNGLIPWSSGADRAKLVVAGAVVEESDASNPQKPQILFALSTTWSGVTIAAPLPLVSLASSHTTSVTCEDVFVEDRFILRGPAPNVLACRKKTVPLGQAFLAMGLCRAGIDLLQQHNSDLGIETARLFESEFATLRRSVLHFCDPDHPGDTAIAPQLRGACNELALRITHAAVAMYKGTALLQGHPAQRLAREALFLLVWSCPNPVIDCTVQLLREG